jgi:secreted trypsin-like serine protease
MKKLFSICSFLCLSLAACAAEPLDETRAPDEETFDEIDSELHNGNVTFVRPEVGVLITAQNKLACTGTLVAPNVVLTAGHCTGPSALFLMKKSATEKFIAYTVIQKMNWGPAPGEQDFGLLRLNKNVPATYAKPAVLSKVPFVKDAKGNVFGYGMLRCDQGGAVAPDFNKRVKPITIAVASNTQLVPFGQYSMCPGDSGGPLFINGQLAAVISGGNQPVPVGGVVKEIWADVADDYAAIKAQVDKWDAMM